MATATTTAHANIQPPQPAQLKIIAEPANGKPRSLSTLQTFLISSLAPSVAVVFTNPFDTAKVRLQLQGEILKAASKSKSTALPTSNPKPIHVPTQVYKNNLDCMIKTFQHEGVKGLQKGLTPAIWREGSKNMFRLGLFDPIMKILHPNSDTPPPAWKRMVGGSICGAMGALACNPFELVKTRLQSAAHSSLAVGHQHNYTGVVNDLSSIVRKDGFLGLYRGSIMSVCRSIIGSGVNLSSYHILKDYLIIKHNWRDDVWCDMVAGLASGLASVIAMNPVDVLRTRYYNQPYEGKRGMLYDSGIDCARKVVSNEGWRALYKGFWSHFMRIGPHFCLTFVFLGIFRRGLLQYYDNQDMKQAFTTFDLNGDKRISVSELATVLKQLIPMSTLHSLELKNGIAGVENSGDKKEGSAYEQVIQNYVKRLFDAANNQGTESSDGKSSAIIKDDGTARSTSTRDQSTTAEDTQGGYIGYPQFRRVTQELRSLLRERSVRTVFDQFDQSRSGFISSVDLTYVVKQVVPRHSMMDETEYDQMIEKNVAVLMKFADLNNDGKIDWEEFLKVMEKVEDVKVNKVVQGWARVSGARIL